MIHRRWALFGIVVCLLAGVGLAATKPVNDDLVTDQVMLKLSGDPVVKGGAIKVDVKEGVATLRGTVAEEKQKERAAKLAKKVKGVKQVINNITIERTPGR